MRMQGMLPAPVVVRLAPIGAAALLRAHGLAEADGTLAAEVGVEHPSAGDLEAVGHVCRHTVFRPRYSEELRRLVAIQARDDVHWPTGTWGWE